VLDTAVDVILLDTTFWGGIRPCIKAAGGCETFQLGVAGYSSGGIRIPIAAKLPPGATDPHPHLPPPPPYPQPPPPTHPGRADEIRRRVDRGPHSAGAGHQARSRQSRPLCRALQAAWPLSLRSGPRPAGLVADHSQRSLGRCQRSLESLRYARTGLTNPTSSS